MKKKIITLAIATMFTLGISTFAQAPQNDHNCKKTENCKRDGKKCDRKDDKKCDRKDGAPGRDKKCINPFEGLNLTEQQQKSISNIPSPRQVMKAARDRESDVKQSPEMRQAVARDIRVNYLKQIKAVLTSDQYVQFLENDFVNARPDKPGKDMKRPGKPGDRDHKGHKCRKGDNTGCNCTQKN